MQIPTLTIRPATEDECELTDGRANALDGATAILLGDDLQAVCNEYGTAIMIRDYRGGEDQMAALERYELLADAYGELL